MVCSWHPPIHKKNPLTLLPSTWELLNYISFPHHTPTSATTDLELCCCAFTASTPVVTGLRLARGLGGPDTILVRQRARLICSWSSPPSSPLIIHHPFPLLSLTSQNPLKETPSPSLSPLYVCWPPEQTAGCGHTAPAGC